MPAEPLVAAPSPSFPLAGCLGRVLLVVLLLIALVIFGVGGALQGFL